MYILSIFCISIIFVIALLHFLLLMMKSQIGRRGQTIVGQFRKIVYKVYTYFKQHEPDKPVKLLKETVSEATGVSISTVARILQEANSKLEEGCTQEDEIEFLTPGTKRTRKSMVDLDDIDMYDFRNIIYNFHKTEGCRVTSKLLLAKLKADFDFKGHLSTLKVIIKNSASDGGKLEIIADC